MGYSTEFKGILKFTNELTASQLAEVKKFLGEDCRNHPEWAKARNLYYVDLELTNDFSGLCWSGAEKTSDMVEIVNMIIHNMKYLYPEFGLCGSLKAQGEDFEDTWELVFENNIAVAKKLIRTGNIIKCPYCEQKFEYEGENNE